MDALIKRGPRSFSHWPLYGQITFIVCLLLVVVGITLAAVEESTRIPGAAILGVVTLVAITGGICLMLSYYRQSYPVVEVFATHRRSTTVHSPTDRASGPSPARSATVTSRTNLAIMAEPESQGQTNPVVLRNITRIESGSALEGSGDWSRSATLTRLPTATSLQYAMETQGSDGLLKMTDFQSFGEEPVLTLSVLPLSAQGTGTPNSTVVTPNRSPSFAAQRPAQSSSSMQEVRSGVREADSGRPVSKSVSSSHVLTNAPGVGAKRQRPRPHAGSGAVPSLSLDMTARRLSLSGTDPDERSTDSLPHSLSGRSSTLSVGADDNRAALRNDETPADVFDT